MKHWQETAEILRRALRVAEVGGRAAVATVARIEGSAYRRPGAKFLVSEDGTTYGGVSGGCLEADVREVALRIARGEAPPRLLHYDTGSDERTVFGLGLGCNGSVDVFVQPVTSPAALEAARRVRDLLRGEEPFAVSTVLEGPLAGRSQVVSLEGKLLHPTGDPALDRDLAARASDLLRQGESSLGEVASLRVFIEVHLPPPHLVVFGAGDDSIPLVEYAGGVGFRVAVVDHRPAFLSPGRFPGGVRLARQRPEDGAASLPLNRRSYAVVKTHSLELDREWVRRLLQTQVAYIGVLGPRARIEEILRQLEAAPDDRVFGPVGLDLGADGPEQVALSIVAELLAVRSGCEPRHLRRRAGRIHAG